MCGSNGHLQHCMMLEYQGGEGVGLVLYWREGAGTLLEGGGWYSTGGRGLVLYWREGVGLVLPCRTAWSIKEGGGGAGTVRHLQHRDGEEGH